MKALESVQDLQAGSGGKSTHFTLKKGHEYESTTENTVFLAFRPKGHSSRQPLPLENEGGILERGEPERGSPKFWV